MPPIPCESPIIGVFVKSSFFNGGRGFTRGTLLKFNKLVKTLINSLQLLQITYLLIKFLLHGAYYFFHRIYALSHILSHLPSFIALIPKLWNQNKQTMKSKNKEQLQKACQNIKGGLMYYSTKFRTLLETPSIREAQNSPKEQSTQYLQHSPHVAYNHFLTPLTTKS